MLNLLTIRTHRYIQVSCVHAHESEKCSGVIRVELLGIFCRPEPGWRSFTSNSSSQMGFSVAQRVDVSRTGANSPPSCAQRAARIRARSPASSMTVTHARRRQHGQHVQKLTQAPAPQRCGSMGRICRWYPPRGDQRRR